jgi:hypothetical protein
LDFASRVYGVVLVQVSPLSAAESEWLATQLATAVALARAYSGDSEDLPTLARLDTTWLAWQSDSSASCPEPNVVVSGLGIAFGKHLATALTLEWAIVTDDFGTDLALFGEPGAVTFFPANMIAKRLEERAPIFTQLHRAAVESVKQLRSRL